MINLILHDFHIVNMVYIKWLLKDINSYDAVNEITKLVRYINPSLLMFNFMISNKGVCDYTIDYMVGDQRHSVEYKNCTSVEALSAFISEFGKVNITGIYKTYYYPTSYNGRREFRYKFKEIKTRWQNYLNNEIKANGAPIIGFRNECFRGSEVTDVRSIIDFEINELENCDIIDHVRDILHIPISDDNPVDDIMYFLSSLFGTSDLCGLWLTDSIDDIKSEYVDRDDDGNIDLDNIDIYEFSIPDDAIVISDLGSGGKLWVSKTPKSSWEDRYINLMTDESV